MRGEKEMKDRMAEGRHPLFLDGQFHDSVSSETIPVVNPATEDVIARIPECTAEEVQQAVHAAQRAQAPWAKLPAVQRAGYIRKIAQGIRENADRLARVITEEQGKILSLARVEVEFTADYMEYMAEWARRYEGEILQSDRPN